MITDTWMPGLTAYQMRVATLVAWPRQLCLKDRFLVIEFFLDPQIQQLKGSERTQLESSYRRFARLVDADRLPSRFSDYDSDVIVRVARAYPTEISGSWRFLSSFLMWLAERKPLHSSLRVMWLPPHVWRSTTAEEARQEVEPVLEVIESQIGEATNLRTLRSIVMLLAKAVSCRTIEELYNLPLSKLPEHPSRGFPLERPVRNIFLKWQRLMGHYYPETVPEEDRYFFPSVRGGGPMTHKLNWLLPIVQPIANTELEFDQTPTLSGSLAICWGTYPELFGPLMESLDRLLTSLLEELEE